MNKKPIPNPSQQEGVFKSPLLLSDFRKREDLKDVIKQSEKRN